MCSEVENLDKCYEVVSAVVQKAGDLIASRFWKSKNVKTKRTHVDMVTETDEEVEKLLIHTLSAAFPHHRFIAEESTSEGVKCELTDSPTWIIDPLDGTLNFVHSFPHSCISIALYVKRESEIAIIYNPVLKQLFTARCGQGAFFNGDRMQVSGQKDLSQSLIMAEFGYGGSLDQKKNQHADNYHRNMLTSIHGARSMGSAALHLAHVALGSADAYYEFRICAWDIAAGALIVREAGGVVTSPSGGPFDVMSGRILAASSQELADKISKDFIQPYL